MGDIVKNASKPNTLWVAFVLFGALIYAVGFHVFDVSGTFYTFGYGFIVAACLYELAAFAKWKASCTARP